MNGRFSNLSLRGKLVLSGVLPAVLVLVVAASAFAIYDTVSYRRFLVRDLNETARFIATTSRAALSFNDPDYPRRILSGLESNPSVLAAWILDEEGNVFVNYFRAGEPPRSSPAKLNEEKNKTNELMATAPIVLDGREIGSVRIAATLNNVWERLIVMLLGVVGALVLLIALAYATSRRLQRDISQPLVALAETARSISEKKDYSVRAESQKGPEFSVLTNVFNQMLQEIQRQDEELRARAAELEHANAELEAFTYSVSHDLRAPLRGISGFTQILSRQYSANMPPDGVDLLNRVQKGAIRLSHLIDDLLSFSHVGAEAIKIEKIDMASIVAEVIAETAQQASGKDVNFQVGELPRVEADATLLRQVYANLLSNAVKYSRTRPSPEIRVGTLAQNGTPVFFVKDNGVGFNMRYASKLFGMFQRLHKAEEFEGTGVGLAIVRRVIERHGGKVWAEAEPDKGATFYFTLGGNGKTN